MSKKIMILLCGSLFLNVLLIGVLTGYMLQNPFGPNFKFPQRDDTEFLAKLPKEKQALYRDIVERLSDGAENSFEEIHQRKEGLIDILTAPQFDVDAYLAEEKKLYDYFEHMRRRSLNATIEFAQQLNQEERKALADHLKGPIGTIMPRPPHGPPPWEKR